jgi:hypothetical protein
MIGHRVVKDLEMILAELPLTAFSAARTILDRLPFKPLGAWSPSGRPSRQELIDHAGARATTARWLVASVLA